MKQLSWRKRIALGFLALAITLSSAGFGLSNLFLISPKGRTFVSSRIASRIQLDTTLQGASWSPWNGITLYGLRIEQPKELQETLSKPLLAVQSIRLSPVWSELVKKRFAVKGIDLVRPDFTIPIELLAMIPAAPADTDLTGSQPPDLVMNQQPSPPSITPLPTPPAVVLTPSDPFPRDPQPQVPEIQLLPEIADPTTFITLSDTRIRVVTTMSKSSLYELTGLDGKIPMGGKKAKTSLVANTISILGNQIADNMKIPIDWNPPNLSSNPINGKIFGIDVICGVQLGLIQGLPLQMVAAIPEQKEKELNIGENTGMKIEAIVGRGGFQGFLSYPASWQGQALARSTGIEARHGGSQTRFDSGHALFIFRNGTLRCMDARLTGEETSILGNATFLSDGRGAANLRIVAAPETLAAVSSFTDPSGEEPYFTPLRTPQRSALDLQLFGRLGDFRYKPNPRAAPIQIQ